MNRESEDNNAKLILKLTPGITPKQLRNVVFFYLYKYE